MVFSIKEQPSGFSALHIFLLEETSNWPVVLTDKTAAFVVFTPMDSNVEAEIDEDSISVKTTERRKDLFEIDIRMQFITRSQCLEAHLDKYKNRPCVVVGCLNNRFQKIYGSDLQPLYLSIEIDDMEKPEDKGATKLKIVGETRHRPVYYMVYESEGEIPDPEPEPEPEPGLAPVITSFPGFTINSGVAMSFQIVATNAPTSFVVSAGQLPSGLSINEQSGFITGIYNGSTQEIDFTITVSNIHGLTSQNIVVSAIGAVTPQYPPFITSASHPITVSGIPFEYQIYATENPTSFGAIDLPAGFSVNTVTGLITGTPDSNEISFTVSATNAAGTTEKLVTSAELDGLPPATTTDFTASQITSNSFFISWTQPFSDVPRDSIEIYQNGSLIKTLSGSTTGALIQMMVPGSTSSFYMRTKDVQGLWSENSNVIEVTQLS
ncbi:putative Ig domain-containing protein [Flavobacterium sp.]|uniref:putative Ig domain-containing protein n=1 Tax=Flavobacterium sp. TaxID=239 RepID=UPI001213EAD7|nr:putative Ig domain-containing protein [Flavobacterium sp.]RZJ71094.1 MAG: hypothetical protein EOO49_11615 [Flavobacterium sp.]